MFSKIRILIFITIILSLIISTATAADYQVIDLTPIFNNDGIAWDRNRGDGDFDAIGQYSPGTFNYAGEEFPPSLSIITSYGIPFQIPDTSDGKKNNLLCESQEIKVTPALYTGAYFLGSSVNGSYKEPMYLQYKDGTIDTTQLALSDWCTSAKFGELPAIIAGFRHHKTGDREPTQNFVWLQSVAVDHQKELTAVIFPKSQSLHVFALTLGQGTPFALTEQKPVSTTKVSLPPMITIQTNKPGNLFYSNESVVVKIIVTHLPDSISRFSFDWELKDSALKTLQSEHQVMSRNKEGGFVFPIRLSSPGNGWYGLTVTLNYLGKAAAKESLLQSKTGFIWMDPPDAVKTDLQTGIGMNQGLDNITIEQADTVTQLAHTAGIKWFRQGFGWGFIEPTKGEWDWQKYDKAVTYAKDNRINQLGLLCYWAGWSQPYTDEGIKQYANYVSQVVSRYKGTIQYWEIWNEPNIFYWKGTPEQYTDLLKAAYQAAKAADPDCKIIACATAGVDTSFILRVLNAGGYAYMDGMSIHPYRNAYPDENGFEQDLQWCRNILEQYHPSTTGYKPKELWITELGWWTAPEGVSESVQASSLVRSMLSGYMSGMVDKYFWYCYANPGNRENYNEDNFGILYNNLSPKPAYLALVNMTRELRGYSYVSTLKTNDGCRYFLFSKGEQKMLVAWCIRGSATIALQADTRTLTITDLYGGKKTLLSSENNLFALSLSEEPTYITGDFKTIGKIVKFIGLNIPSKNIPQGTKAEIKLQLKNIFDKDIISNVAIQVSDKIQRNLVPENSENMKYVNIKPGEEKEVHYLVDLSDNSRLGLTPVELRVDFKDGGSFRLQTELRLIGRKK